MKNQSAAAGSKKTQNRNGLMNKLFNTDEPLMKGLAVAADILIINLLTVVLCIPVVTIGPAFIAMNDMIIRILRKEEGYIIKPYFQSVKANFKKGALMSLLLVVAGGLLVADYFAASAFIPELKVVIIAIGVILLAISFYAFALFARYENTFGATLKNAAVLFVGYFPRTLVMVICSVGLWLVCTSFYRIGAPVLLLFGFSLPCYINIMLLNAVFRKLEGEDEEKDEEDYEV